MHIPRRLEGSRSSSRRGRAHESIAEVIKYGKDIVLLGERVDALMAGRKERPPGSRTTSGG